MEYLDILVFLCDECKGPIIVSIICAELLGEYGCLDRSVADKLKADAAT